MTATLVLRLRQTAPMSTRRFLFVAAAFWLLFGLVAGIQVWISMITHGHDTALVLGYQPAVWMVWLAPTALIVALAPRMPVAPPRPLATGVHVLAATAIGLLHSARRTPRACGSMTCAPTSTSP